MLDSMHDRQLIAMIYILIVLWLVGGVVALARCGSRHTQPHAPWLRHCMNCVKVVMSNTPFQCWQAYSRAQPLLYAPREKGILHNQFVSIGISRQQSYCKTRHMTTQEHNTEQQLIDHHEKEQHETRFVSSFKFSLLFGSFISTMLVVVGTYW